MTDPILNDGVLLGRRETDFIAGTLPYEVRNPSGDWTPYLPTAERQSNRRTDTMACVTYSLLNVIETQIKFLTGREINFSDRWLAKMSNTTMAGNYLWAVADAVRFYGLVLQEDYPEPSDYTWDSYYAPIPPEIQLKGKQFLENWSIAYEWIDLTPESLEKHLKHGPLQVVLPGHAIEAFTFNKPEDIVRYFDTYDPFMKSTPRTKLSDALKVILTPINMNQTKIVLSQDGKTVYKAIPVATDFENFKKQASVEGIPVPDPIPPASSL